MFKITELSDRGVPRVLLGNSQTLADLGSRQDFRDHQGIDHSEITK